MPMQEDLYMDSPGEKDVAVIVGCGKQKKQGERLTAHKYDSTYYEKKKTYAQYYSDRHMWWVLSAKYGMIPSYKFIRDYDQEMSEQDKQEMVELVKQQLEKAEADLRTFDEIHVLAGSAYVEILREANKEFGFNFVFIFQEKEFSGMGKQIGWMCDKIQEIEARDVPVDRSL